MRVLRRPMFRSGGSSGEGITSGLVPRQGYELGKDVQQRKDILRQAAGVMPDRSLSNLLIDFGLNVASAPPTGSIFSTAAGAAQQPFQRYQQAQQQRGLFDQKLGLAAAESAMAHADKMKELALKGQTSGLIDVQKKARILWNNRRTEQNPNGSFNTDTGEDWQSYEEVEAFVTEKSIKSKSGEYTPKVERDIRIGNRIEFIVDRDSVSPDYARSISETIEDALDGKFDDAEAEDKSDELSGRIDRNQLYIQPDDVTKGDEGTYILSADTTNVGGEYVINKAYFNPQDGQFYVYDGKGTFSLIVLPGQGG